jgi:hypothetical protein
MIPVEIAAMEVLKWIKSSQTTTMIGIVAPFIIALMVKFSIYVTAVGILIVCGTNVWFLFMARKEEIRIKQKYFQKQDEHGQRF